MERLNIAIFLIAVALLYCFVQCLYDKYNKDEKTTTTKMKISANLADPMDWKS